jgi:hypothetical protein
MKSIRTVLALCAIVGIVTGCGGSGSDVGTELGISRPQARFINALTFGPNVDYYLNSKPIAAGVPYKGVTRYQDIDARGHTVHYTLTGVTTPIASQSFTAARGHHYTSIAVPGANSLIAVIDDPFNKRLLSDKARVRAFNASLNATNVDIYIVPTNTKLETSPVSATLTGAAYQSASPPSGQDSAYLNGGTYDVIVTIAGTRTPIFQAPIALDNNADWLIVTIPSGDPATVGANRIRLLVAQGNEADTSAVELTSQ